jgi:hypothetical protein
MQWPVPADGADPWYDSFVDLMGAVDTSVYASREDRNAIMTGGGVFAFTAPNLAWDDTIQILSANTGFLWEVVAGNVDLEDGEVLYVELSRAPPGNTTLTPLVASNLTAVSDGDAAYVLCVRIGTTLYFRQGSTLVTGETSEIISGAGLTVQQAGADVGERSKINFVNGATVADNPGQNRVDVTLLEEIIVQAAGATIGTRHKLNFVSGAAVADNPGQTRVDVTIPTPVGVATERVRRHLSLATNESTYDTSYQVVGSFSFDPDDYTITGMTKEIKFLAAGFVTLAALSGDIQLYNLTDAAQEAILNFTGAGDVTTVKKISASLTLPTAEKIYEVRIKVTGGVPPTDKIFAMWAGLQIDNIYV